MFIDPFAAQGLLWSGVIEPNFIRAAFDSNSNKVVIAWADGIGSTSYGKAIVGTVSDSLQFLLVVLATFASAETDIIEMRSLLEAWRKSVWSTIVKVTTVALLTFIAGAVWMTMGK